MFPASGATRAWGPDAVFPSPPPKPVFPGIHKQASTGCCSPLLKVKHRKATSVNTVSLSLLLAHSSSMSALVFHFFICSTREWLFKGKELSMGLLKLLFNMTRKLSWLGHSLDLKQENRLHANGVVKEITAALEVRVHWNLPPPQFLPHFSISKSSSSPLLFPSGAFTFFWSPTLKLQDLLLTEPSYPNPCAREG